MTYSQYVCYTIGKLVDWEAYHMADRILILDDEKEIADLVAVYLENENSN